MCQHQQRSHLFLTLFHIARWVARIAQIAHSKDFQRTFKGNCVFECIQGASILRMLEDWMGKETFRDGCRVSEKALPIYFIPFLLLYLFVGVFFGFSFSFSEIFERFPLQECQNSQLLGIAHRCTLVYASFHCYLKFNCNLLFIHIHVHTYKQTCARICTCVYSVCASCMRICVCM